MAQALEGARATPIGQLTLDPTVAPGGILPAQSEDDRHRAGGDARSTWAVGHEVPHGPTLPDPPGALCRIPGVGL